MTRKEARARTLRRRKIAAVAVAALLVALALALYLHHHTVAVLQPAGTIASQERSLMYTAALLGMIVIIPVYILTVFIFWKYRESTKTDKKYTPDWDHSRWLEGVWWAIPLIIITILSIIAWRSSYALDPFKPLAATAKPLVVQVVALDWKWLFIYPSQKVASVNQARIPVNRPVTFDITSDTVMNSFWVPQLSGQIYAMPGMSTELHLMAGRAGSYKGSSANISGDGFAGMDFSVKAEPESDFDAWTTATAKTAGTLTLASYNQLAKPSRDNPISNYSVGTPNLFDYIVMKYMEPGADQ